MTALFATGVAVSSWARAIVLSPITDAAAGIFLFLLWTIIGISVLIDRRKPRLVQAHHDYRYGLTFEGFVPAFPGANSSIHSQRGVLAFSLLIRNYSPGPIKYMLEAAEVHIETRSLPKYKSNSLTGYLPRGGGKQLRPGGFPGGNMAEFYGKGEIKGTADLSVTYGPPDGPPIRRLKIGIEMTMIFPDRGNVDAAKGVALAYSDNILLEEDEPLKT